MHFAGSSKNEVDPKNDNDSLPVNVEDLDVENKNTTLNDDDDSKTNSVIKLDNDPPKGPTKTDNATSRSDLSNLKNRIDKRTDSKRRKRQGKLKPGQHANGSTPANTSANTSKNGSSTVLQVSSSNSNLNNCSTSSKDTSAESDANQIVCNNISTHNSRPENQVSRLPGQFKPKR